MLDTQRVVRYWGRIDDQFGFQDKGIAYQRSEPKHRYLAVALDELLAGTTISQLTVESQGCRIGRIRQPAADSEVTYSKQIAAILNANCVFCHRPGQIPPFPLTTYDESVGWAEMIREVVQERRMPPWHADPAVGHFSNDARLGDQDKALICEWVENGARRRPAGFARSTEFAEGWQIAKPDQVLYMADKPFDVPATGPIEYQRFVVDPGWTEDKWIRAGMRARQSGRGASHHRVHRSAGRCAERAGWPSAINWLGGLHLGCVSDRSTRDLPVLCNGGRNCCSRCITPPMAHRNRTVATWDSCSRIPRR